MFVSEARLDVIQSQIWHTCPLQRTIGAESPPRKSVSEETCKPHIQGQEAGSAPMKAQRGSLASQSGQRHWLSPPNESQNEIAVIWVCSHTVQSVVRAGVEAGAR